MLFWTLKTFTEELEMPEFAKSVFKEVRPYITKFLCSQHPFRKASMCPFVPAAVKYDQIYFTFFNESLNVKQTIEFIKECIVFFQSINNKINGSIIILFPKEFEIKKLLDIQILNKEQCVINYTMLGALYPSSPAPSLHNDNYFPLRTPTPVLVIRDIVPSDVIFLEPRYYNIKRRLILIEGYLKKFTSTVNDESGKRYLDDARKIRSKFKKIIYIRKFLLIILLCVLITNILFFLLKK